MQSTQVMTDIGTLLARAKELHRVHDPHSAMLMAVDEYARKLAQSNLPCDKAFIFEEMQWQLAQVLYQWDKKRIYRYWSWWEWRLSKSIKGARPLMKMGLFEQAVANWSREHSNSVPATA